MTNNPYKVLGTETAIMRGRNRLFADLIGHLTKPSPAHISIIGPRHYGKTVILTHLAEYIKKESEHFLTSTFWDLSRGTPTSDSEFLKLFAAILKVAVQPFHSDIDYLEVDEDDILPLIDFLFADLENQGQKVLVIMDGFDYLLANPDITRHLWDSLMGLAQRKSLRIVTGSRARLRELCRSKESMASKFWQIFDDPPMQVSHLAEEDWENLVEPFKERGISFDKAAERGIVNWTGGVPLLSAALLNKLWEATSDGVNLSKPAINDIANKVLAKHLDLFETLWDDCTNEMQSDIVRLSQLGEIPSAEMSYERCQLLLQRGYITLSEGKIRTNCRLIDEFAQTKSIDLDFLHRLFGDKDRFGQNIKGLLELRFDHIKNGVDPELRGYVEKAIQDLLPEPKHAVVWARSIAERALDLIWSAELPTDRTLPKEWVEEWKHAGEILRGDPNKLPKQRGGQCHILRLITGTQNANRVAKYATKPTFILVDHIQSVGDFGQHKEDEVILGFAVAFCLAAIALCESLKNDINRTP